MTLNRLIAPPAQEIQQVTILKAEKHILDNQLTLYAIEAGKQPVIRLELIFEIDKRATFAENFAEIGQFSAKMLSEGTSKQSAAEISETFDKFGAFLEINQNADRITITVHCLTKHLPTILPTLQEMLQDSVFPKKELEIIKTIATQSLKVNLEKTAFVAGQLLREKLFGETHVYGKSSKEANIQAVTQQDVKRFYEEQVKNKDFKLFISGKFGENEIQLFNQYFGKNAIIFSDKDTAKFTSETKETTENKSILVEKQESVQSTIRIGKLLFGRKNSDFFKFIVTNTLLGGFFGSRLMKNIREDKGFTYGISSSLVQMLDAAYFLIGTDVKKEVTAQTIEEIHKEIKLLQTELVTENELEIAKNYMIGSFAGSLNTPFEVADRQKIIIIDELPSDFYDDYIQKVRNVSPQDVLEMANKYLIISNLTEVVVGGK